MSFLSILKTVGKDAMIGVSITAPIISMIDPAIGAPLTAIANMVLKAEQTYTGEKQGATKKQYVIDEFTALLPMFQDALKSQAGLLLTVDAAQISAVIDATVAQMNAAVALKSSFKITKI